MKSKGVSTVKMIEYIKNCRKVRAAEYRKKNNICAITAAIAFKEAGPALLATQINIEEDLVTHLTLLIKKLEDAVKNYNLSANQIS